MDNGRPVTKAELHAELNAAKDELTASMRQIETNLLAAFHSYARVSSHLHTLDAGQQDLNARMMALEDRVLALETRQA